MHVGDRIRKRNTWKSSWFVYTYAALGMHINIYVRHTVTVSDLHLIMVVLEWGQCNYK